MADAHTNFAITTVATIPSPATSGTTCAVASGTGALFPAVPFNATVWPAGVNPTSANAEIVRVTNIAGDTFTITRAQEGTSARTWLVNCQIAATVTAKVLADAEYGAHRWYNVRDPEFGYGTLSDSAALQACIDAAGANPIVFPAGDYTLTTGLTFTADYGTIYGAGARLLCSADITPLTVGNASGAPQLYPQILGNLRAYKSGSLGTGAGIKFLAVYNGRFEISAQRFASNIEVRPPSGLGFAYNQVYMQDMTGCGHSGLRLNTGDGGFVNENDFYHGRFDNANATCTALIYVPDTGTTYGNPNNNRFHSPNLELSGTATVDALYIDGGYHNAIIHPRPEVDGGTTINQAKFWITSDALLAFVDDRYIGSSSATIKNEGTNTRFFTNSQRFVHYRDIAGDAEQGERVLRSAPNTNGLPLAEAMDIYASSGNNMVRRGVLVRNTGSGYFEKWDRIVSLVSRGSRLYECTADHTSGASTEPGVGASWTTVWRLLPTGSDVAGAGAWVTSTGYTGTTELGRLKDSGELEVQSLRLNVVAPTVGAGEVGFGATTASTVGAAGGASALPATPTGYLIINVAGTAYKVPYYAS